MVGHGRKPDGGGGVCRFPSPLSLQVALVFRHPLRKGTVMLRKRLASLALAAGVGLTSGCGCLGFGTPCCAPPACCPSSPCCGSGVSSFGGSAILGGYGGGAVEA